MPLKNAGYLNGIEFKSIREELGLTQAELMRLMNIKNYKTIVRWEKGDNIISKQACDTIIELLKSTGEDINRSYNELIERYKRTCYADFVLFLTDDPKHNAAVRKAYCKFIADGKKAHLIRFDEQDFNYWRETLRLDDTPKTREQWALNYWKACI